MSELGELKRRSQVGIRLSIGRAIRELCRWIDELAISIPELYF